VSNGSGSDDNQPEFEPEFPSESDIDFVPAAATTSPTPAGIFTDDSVATATSKLLCLEAFISIMNRDYKFHEFMREILLAIMKVVKSESGSILELDPSSHSLFFRAVIGRSSEQLTKFTIPKGQGIVGHVAESRQPLAVPNVEENAVYLKSVQDAIGFTARNLICAPIIIRGQVYGVVELLNRVGEENYSPSDIELLTYLCDAAAKIIEVRLMLGWAMQQGKDTKKDAA
jgi:GAF domain-containing protein